VTFWALVRRAQPSAVVGVAALMVTSVLAAAWLITSSRYQFRIRWSDGEMKLLPSTNDAS
jgi:hypothetical protein